MIQPTKDVAKEQLLEGFHTVIAETDQLLRTAASASGEKAVLRADAEYSLARAQEQLHSLQRAVTEGSQAAARATDEYVHENPWRAIGIAAGISLVAGTLIGLTLNRR
jgi:ElaB/YqjD/DUF883 family membrane-anchored ribosome-binding protein